ncbi:DUF6146 family protein [Robertkochia flava]|uniref:DUF6146 family protein n=1 Tax=Robertkochia flava TaxID=3447986 RepID=UPI001CCE9E09|nr:DUF6146 family protein [Robertkochia marina]
MRTFLISIFIIALITACSGGKSQNSNKDLEITPEEQEIFESEGQDTVRIGNDSTEYDIIIMDPGFYPWLNRIAQPRGYYSQNFMENRNNIFVTNWNNRVMQPQTYDPNLYMFPINYDPSTDYGYEVNYMLFNYFLYFLRKYNQRLGPFYPRIN